jgi:hypothetical protein
MEIHLHGGLDARRARERPLRIFEIGGVLAVVGLRALTVRASRALLIGFVHGHRFTRKQRGIVTSRPNSCEQAVNELARSFSRAGAA